MPVDSIVMRGGKLLTVGGKVTTCEEACCGCWGCSLPDPVNVAVKVTIGSDDGTVNIPFASLDGETSPFQNTCERIAEWNEVITTGVSNSPLVIDKSYSRNSSVDYAGTQALDIGGTPGTKTCETTQNVDTVATIKYTLSRVIVRLSLSKTLTHRVMTLTLVSVVFRRSDNNYTITFENVQYEYHLTATNGAATTNPCVGGNPFTTARNSTLCTYSDGAPGTRIYEATCDYSCPQTGIPCESGTWGNSLSYGSIAFPYQTFTISTLLYESCATALAQVVSHTHVGGFTVGSVPFIVLAQGCCTITGVPWERVDTGDTSPIILSPVSFELTVS
jgi:hypothetical protein